MYQNENVPTTNRFSWHKHLYIGMCIHRYNNENLSSLPACLLVHITISHNKSFHASYIHLTRKKSAWYWHLATRHQDRYYIGNYFISLWFNKVYDMIRLTGRPTQLHILPFKILTYFLINNKNVLLLLITKFYVLMPI